MTASCWAINHLARLSKSEELSRATEHVCLLFGFQSEIPANPRFPAGTTANSDTPKLLTC
jgi:hypothetical protein